VLYVTMTLIMTLCSAAFRRGIKHRPLDDSRAVRLSSRHWGKRATDPFPFDKVRLDLFKYDFSSCKGSGGFIYGLTQLNGLIYIACRYTDQTDHIIVYNSSTIAQQSVIDVKLPTPGFVNDVVACPVDKNLYLLGATADLNATVYKMSLDTKQVVILAAKVGNVIQLRLTSDCKPILLGQTAVMVYDANGIQMSFMSTPLGTTEHPYRLMMMDTGKFLIAHFNMPQTYGDVSIVASDGTMLVSYNKTHGPTDVPIYFPIYLEPLSSGQIFTIDWNHDGTQGIYLLSSDLTHGRMLLQGAPGCVIGAYYMSYDSTSNLLLVQFIGQNRVNAYKVAAS